MSPLSKKNCLAAKLATVGAETELYKQVTTMCCGYF